MSARSRGCLPPLLAAAKTLPYRYTFPTGPGLRAGEARPRRPAPRAPQAGDNPRISGGFARSPPRRLGAPIHTNRLQKNGKYSWNVHCNFSQSSPFCSIMNHRHSRGPGAHARRAAASGARFPDRLSLCSQVPISHPRFSVCRERAPSPARPAPGGRIVCFACTSLARGAAAPTGPARRAASYRKGGMPMIVRKEKCSCKS